MQGPLGGQPGSTRVVGKGQRRLMTKGIKMGSYVRIAYRVRSVHGSNQAEEDIDYEGTIVDKRIGGQDRESYVELKNALRLDAKGRVVACEKTKRLTDAFIESCQVVEKRDVSAVAEAIGAAEVAAARGSRSGGGDGDSVAVPGMLLGVVPGVAMPGSDGGDGSIVMQGGMVPMGMAMPGMMPMITVGMGGVQVVGAMMGGMGGGTGGGAWGSMCGGLGGGAGSGNSGGAMLAAMPHHSSMMPMMGGLGGGMRGGMPRGVLPAGAGGGPAAPPRWEGPRGGGNGDTAAVGALSAEAPIGSLDLGFEGGHHETGGWGSRRAQRSRSPPRGGGCDCSGHQ